ncbi:MAG: DUF2975 domain-containing protein [bacterium]|nr:DUF2975 domain-containing protein [bacterium]
MTTRGTRALATGINVFLWILMALLALAGVLFLAWVVVLGPAWGPDDAMRVRVPVTLLIDPQAVAVTGPEPGVPVVLTGTHTELNYVPETAMGRWAYGLSGLVIVTVGMYLVRLLHGVVDSIGRGEPFVRANASRFQRVGWITVALTLITTGAKYLGGRAVIARLEATGAELRPWFDPQVEFLVFGLLFVLLGTLCRQGRELAEDSSLTI